MHIGQASAYALGQEQNLEGVFRDHNPFHTPSVERDAWFAGWDSEAPAREAWEADLHARAVQWGDE